MKLKKTTSWKISLQKSVYFFLVISTVLLFLGCNARKTELVKEIDKLKSIDKLETISNEWFKEFEANAIRESNFNFIREFSENGNVIKETLNKSEKKSNSSKSKEYIKNITHITYKSIITYKSVKNKKTQKEQISNWVFYFGILCALIFGLVVWYVPKKG